MTMEKVVILVVMVISFFVSMKFMSDIISERIVNNRIMMTIISLMLAIYPALGIAIFAEYYYFTRFSLLMVSIVTISIFFINILISVTIGVLKLRKDERIRLEIIRDSYQQMDNSANKESSTKIISFEKEKKKRKASS